MRRGWAKCCRCGGWAGVMSLQPQEQHAVLLSVPHCLLIPPSRVPMNQSHWLIAGFPMVLWSLVFFFDLIVGYPKRASPGKNPTPLLAPAQSCGSSLVPDVLFSAAFLSVFFSLIWKTCQHTVWEQRVSLRKWSQGLWTPLAKSSSGIKPVLESLPSFICLT